MPQPDHCELQPKHPRLTVTNVNQRKNQAELSALEERTEVVRSWITKSDKLDLLADQVVSSNLGRLSTLSPSFKVASVQSPMKNGIINPSLAAPAATVAVHQGSTSNSIFKTRHPTLEDPSMSGIIRDEKSSHPPRIISLVSANAKDNARDYDSALVHVRHTENTSLDGRNVFKTEDRHSVTKVPARISSAKDSRAVGITKSFPETIPVTPSDTENDLRDYYSVSAAVHEAKGALLDDIIVAEFNEFPRSRMPDILQWLHPEEKAYFHNRTTIDRVRIFLQETKYRKQTKARTEESRISLYNAYYHLCQNKWRLEMHRSNNRQMYKEVQEPKGLSLQLNDERRQIEESRFTENVRIKQRRFEEDERIRERRLAEDVCIRESRFEEDVSYERKKQGEKVRL